MVAYLLQPDIFGGREVRGGCGMQQRADVGHDGGGFVGSDGEAPANVPFMREIDADRYFHLVIERMGRL